MKKNLIEMQKGSFFRRLAFVAVVLAVLLGSSSCKHENNKPKNNTPEKTEVLLNFVKGANVDRVTPENIKVAKGSPLTLSVLKEKINVEYTMGYEFDKFCISSKDGDAITEDGSFKPTTNTNIYVIAKKKSGGGGGDTEAPSLTSLKVDGVAITPIKDVMTANNTNKEKVKIEYTSSPEESMIMTAPTLSTSNEWGLVDGKNTLTITVKKNETFKAYTLTITKNEQMPDETPKITSITIGAHKKEGDGIVEHNSGTQEPKIIEIPVPRKDKDGEYAVEVTTNVDSAKIEWTPALEDGKVKFGEVKNDEDAVKEFSVKVSKDGKESNYKVKVMMMTYNIFISGGRYEGKKGPSINDEMHEILQHKDDIKITLLGEAEILTLSKITNWQTILIDGQKSKVQLPEDHFYKALGRHIIKFSSLKEEKKVKVIVSNSQWDENTGKPTQPWLATEEFNFTLICGDKKADFPLRAISLNDKFIINAFSYNLANLFAENPPQFKSDKDKASIDVVFEKMPKEVKINNQKIEENQIETFQVDGIDLYRAKLENIDIESAGTVIEIVATPKDEDAVLYRETTMKIKITK